MERLWIAGTGRAALPMLERLHDAGLKAATLVEADGGAASPQGPGLAAVGTVIVVPRDLAEIEAILFESLRLARDAPALRCIVIAATLSPRYVRALRSRIAAEVALIDAPFHGTVRAAQSGRLSFLLGGNADEIDRLMPVFRVLGRSAARMGGFGTAMAAKALSDSLAATSSALTRIALDWAEAQGIEDKTILEVVEGTLAQSLVRPGAADTDTDGPNGGDERLSVLVGSVETALDTALASAHLIPPRAIEELFRSMRTRSVH